MDQAPEVLAFHHDFVAAAPVEVGTLAQLRLALPLPVIPSHLHGTPIVALLVCYAGSVKEGQRVSCRCGNSAGPAADAIAPKPLPVAPADDRRRLPPRPPLLLEILATAAALRWREST
jgi:hypothetical protein